MEFRQGHIRGESVNGAAQRELLRGAFDLLIAAPSWDDRSTVITGCLDLTAANCVLLLFSGRDPSGRRERNEKALTEFVESHCSRIIPISGESVTLAQTWESLWRAIRQVALEKRQPLKLALDLSTFPRFYSLAAIVGCLRLGYASNLSILYSEGEYAPTAEDVAHREYSFSGGEWGTAAIPFLEGRHAPSRRKHIVASLGFEGSKTLRVLSREDPDRISVLFPDPGTNPDYPAITEAQNRFVIETYNVPPAQVVRAHAADAIAAWRGLSQSALERPATEDTYYLSCGTKPHALGMALRAFCVGYPCVLYNAPERHNFLKVVPTGHHWAYHLRDLSIMQ